MVNMNKYKDPSVYGLCDQNGRVFYVGRTGTNAQNRLWEHIYRARSGHMAPVYQMMRRIGYNTVTFKVLERIADDSQGKQVEAKWIKKLIDSGLQLMNQFGRDGVPDSWPQSLKEHGVPSRKGKPTWIKGKTGIEAGWTEERKQAQRDRALAKRKRKAIDG